MYLVRVDWDANNRKKIAAHGVNSDEFEQAFAGRRVADQKIVGLERRKFAVGQTEAGRILAMVYTMRAGKVRPITAYESRKARGQWPPKP
jgi:uncharacterized DUF497 family protein